MLTTTTDPMWLRFVSGPDIDQLGLTPADVVAAATDVVAAHGRGETVFEPRTHLVPDNDGRGHFNVLRGGPLTVGALEDGTADVANIFSTDSAISVNDWVVLEDPENLYLSQNILPLIRSDAVTPEVEEALNGVSEALTTENLTEALARVQVDKDDPVTVAKEFLEENGLV